MAGLCAANMSKTEISLSRGRSLYLGVHTTVSVASRPSTFRLTKPTSTVPEPPPGARKLAVREATAPSAAPWLAPVVPARGVVTVAADAWAGGEALSEPPEQPALTSTIAPSVAVRRIRRVLILRNIRTSRMGVTTVRGPDYADGGWSGVPDSVDVCVMLTGSGFKNVILTNSMILCMSS